MKKNQYTLHKKDNYRIVTISDIHGHLDIFKDLLERCDLQEEDILIILGDFINKGPDSLAALDYMIALSKRPNTYILKGNHEYFICHYVFNNRQEARFLRYIKEKHFETIIHELIERESFNLDSCSQPEALMDFIMSAEGDGFTFMHTLPAILFIDDLIFVHGGYDPDIDIETEENKLLKFDDYNRLSKVNEQTVIVGHWPATNLRTSRNSNLPYYNEEKNIITIDGGMGVTNSGELNALIIEKKKGHRHMRHIQANGFRKTKVIRHHDFHTEAPIFVNYPHFDVELVEKGDRMSKYRHIQSGQVLSIFNSLVKEVDGKPQVITAYINHFLNLTVGTTVELVMVYDDCALVKHDDAFGWLWKDQLDL